MKKYVIILIVVLLAGWNEANLMASDLKLHYENPAEEWVQALPLGNGRLGAMVFGGTSKERIQLNEESLWAGCPVDVFPQDYAKHMAEVQRLVLAGDRAAAREYGLANLTMTPTSFRSYEPLGDIYLDFGEVGTVSNYRRQLSLNDASTKTVYKANGATISREVFISAPDDVLVMRITTDKPKTLSFTVRLTRHKDATVTVKGTDSRNRPEPNYPRRRSLPYTRKPARKPVLRSGVSATPLPRFIPGFAVG